MIIEGIKKILIEIDLVLTKVKEEEVEKLVDEIVRAQKIILVGAGRVGLSARGFAMRLGHLGLLSFTTADTSIPAIGEKDLLIVCSGSGETQATYDLALIGKNHNVRICAITANPKSRIGKLADLVVQIKAPTKLKSVAGLKSIQPMTTLNEQCLMIFFDSLVLKLMKKLGENDESMWKRHSNLE